MAEETAAEGKTLRMTTGIRTNKRQSKKHNAEMGTHKTRPRRMGEKTGGGEVGAKRCYKQSVQTPGDEDEEAERADRGRGGERMANEGKEEDDEDKRHVEANTEEPTPRGEEDETQDE